MDYSNVLYSIHRAKQQKKGLNPVSLQQFKRRIAAGRSEDDAVEKPSIKSNGTKRQREKKVIVKRTPIKSYNVHIPLSVKDVIVGYTEKDRKKYAKELVKRFGDAMKETPFKKECLQENSETMKKKGDEYSESAILAFNLQTAKLRNDIARQELCKSKLINLLIIVSLLLAILIVQHFIS